MAGKRRNDLDDPDEIDRDDVDDALAGMKRRFEASIWDTAAEAVQLVFALQRELGDTRDELSDAWRSLEEETKRADAAELKVRQLQAASELRAQS